MFAQQKPTAETASWWAQAAALANDGMEGRDTGTAAYERAAKYVAAQFAAAGLKPAGDGGTFFQRVPMHEVDLDMARSSVEIQYEHGSPTPLRLLEEVAVSPPPGMSYDENPKMIFVGYGMPDAKVLPLLKHRIAVFFNNTPVDLPAGSATFTADRIGVLANAGVAAMVSIDNPAATEPTHWPAAYARTVQLPTVTPLVLYLPPVIRIGADAAPKLFLDAQRAVGDPQASDALPGRSLRVSCATANVDCR